MAKQEQNQLNIVVVALVALVAIVGLVALVLNAGAFASAPFASAPYASGAEFASAADENIAGEASATACGECVKWCESIYGKGARTCDHGCSASCGGGSSRVRFVRTG